jgi:hypothetical protein
VKSEISTPNDYWEIISRCIWLTVICEINVREYLRGNQKWKIQRNWQHRVHKMKKNNTKQKQNTICVGHNAQTNNVNKTRT